MLGLPRRYKTKPAKDGQVRIYYQSFLLWIRLCGAVPTERNALQMIKFVEDGRPFYFNGVLHTVPASQ